MQLYATLVLVSVSHVTKHVSVVTVVYQGTIMIIIIIVAVVTIIFISGWQTATSTNNESRLKNRNKWNKCVSKTHIRHTGVVSTGVALSFLSPNVCLYLLDLRVREWRLHEATNSNFGLLWPWSLTPRSAIACPCAGGGKFVPICVEIASFVFKISW